jgi:hypothetical protein
MSFTVVEEECFTLVYHIVQERLQWLHAPN